MKAPSPPGGVSVPPCCYVGKTNIMARMNIAQFFARFEEAGKKFMAQSYEVVASFGTVSTKAQFSSKTGGWFILVKDQNGKTAPVGCSNCSQTLLESCSLWEVKELVLLEEFAIDGKTMPKGHVSFKAYPVVEEAE